MSAYASAHGREWYADVPRSARSATLSGFAVILAAVAGFGYWASTAQIAGAKVASGSFTVTGQNKIIQHLEGGIIEEILVNEGDIVERDQVLIRLDEVAAKTELRRLALRRARLEAMQARLQTEIQEGDTLVLPADLLVRAKDDPDVADIVDSQLMTFTARHNSLHSKIATLEKGILGLEERIEGGEVQLASVNTQLDLITEELKGKMELLEKDLITKPQVLALKRARAGLKGEIGRLVAEMGDAQERIARAREQIASVRNDAIESSVQDMERVAAELDDVRERIEAAQSILERVDIVSPVRGVVVELGYHTAGGVIAPGAKVMEILPLEEDLLIQARIQPSDIDQVRIGQKATVRLTALSQRITPMIDGEVIYVSADTLANQNAATPSAPTDIYVVRVQLDPADVHDIPGFVPTPGMPVEVYIKTGERTFLQYLLKPVKDSMQRAFREE